MTNKQRRFCEEYIIDLNASHAAIQAGYSKSTANKKAPGWVGKSREDSTCPEIFDYIQKLMAERSQRTAITADRVLKELGVIAFARIDDYVTIDTKEVQRTRNRKKVTEKQTILNMKPMEVIDKEKIPAIASIKYGTRGIEFRLHDKQKALEDLGRHLGMFTDNTNLHVVEDSTIKVVLKRKDPPAEKK